MRRDPKYRTEKNTCLFLNGKISDQLAFEREPQITVFDFSLIELDYFTCRLSMNYRRDEQNFISVQEILDDYVNNSSEKEKFPLQVKEMGIILKEAFPQASIVQRRVTVAEYGSTRFQKPQDWKKTVLNGKTCQLSQKNSIGFYLALATISLSV